MTSSRDWDRNPATWTTGAKVPLDVNITMMADIHLGKALAHQKVVLQLPQDWWVNPATKWKTACTVMCTESHQIKGLTYLNCQIIRPTVCRDEGQILQFPLSNCDGVHSWNERRLLNLQHNHPATLEDLGINTVPGVSAVTAVLAAWMHIDAANANLADLQAAAPHRPLYAINGPFEDREQNMLWASRVVTEADQYLMAQVDILEPDPKSLKEAMKHPHLAPFWASAAIKEMSGLEDCGCFKKHYIKDLSEDQKKHIFGSRFHHKIKRNTKTGQVKSFKIRLVIMGNRMEKGEDFVDAFAPVPRATATRILLAIAAANGYEIHSCDFTQAFIQGEWDSLPEEMPQVFIRPPPGWSEEPGVVYEVLRPLYGIPTSARALHFTLDNWLQANKFVKSNFEESVWVREADAQFPERIMMSAHIDDTLILCKCLKVMQAFKLHLLSKFDGTDEGEVTEYLGCVIERDRDAGTITLSQKHYSKRILSLYNMLDANHRKTPLQPGARLSKKDCPDLPDPTLHCLYRGIVGHLSFLVMMTRPDLAFAFAELSRFVQAPGEVHMSAAKHMLSYLAGTANESITYSAPTDSLELNVLHGWVDSDFAADPDTRFPGTCC